MLMSTSAATSYYGVKLSVVIAGFIGSVISLSFVQRLTRTQMAVAVGTGTVTANYLTPIALYYTGVAVHLESGIAFLIGIMAMNIIPGFIRLSELFRSDPRSFIPGQRGQADNADDR